MSEARYWIGLSLVPEVGPVTARNVVARFGNPRAVFSASLDELRSVPGVSRERAENIRRFDLWDLVDRHAAIMEEEEIAVVGFSDSPYPEILKEVPDAPVVIYMKGEYRPEDRFGIAVVGSRKNTHYGESVTHRISGELAAAGFTIISGMARGIDTLAHKSAMAAGGRTIAVLGSGLDVSYPSENSGLMARISESGCVISEFLPGTLPSRENFPRRNRLISGLSLGVLVVEAARGSGSLITAHYALDQNREVFAVPGNITSRMSAGTNHLIREGAKAVFSAEDIIGELAPVLRGFVSARRSEGASLGEEENKLCSILSREPKHVDAISREAGLPVQTVLNMLLPLELQGVVRQSDGKRFYLA